MSANLLVSVTSIHRFGSLPRPKELGNTYNYNSPPRTKR